MQNIYYLIDDVFYLVTYSSYILVSLALLYFFWGAANLILKSSEEEKRKENIQRLVWGLIILFVMVSIAGIINMVQYSFGLDVYPNQNLLERL